MINGAGSERRQLVEHMLKELEVPKRRLTTWEKEFLESIREQHAVRQLSKKQFAKLESIYAEKTE